MNAAKPSTAPRQKPIRVPLGTFTRRGRDFTAELVITPERLADLIRLAMTNRDGRAVLAGGGIAVLARRVIPPRPSTEAAPPSPTTARPGAPR